MTQGNVSFWLVFVEENVHCLQEITVETCMQV